MTAFSADNPTGNVRAAEAAPINTLTLTTDENTACNTSASVGLRPSCPQLAAVLRGRAGDGGDCSLPGLLSSRACSTVLKPSVGVPLESC